MSNIVVEPPPVPTSVVLEVSPDGTVDAGGGAEVEVAVQGEVEELAAGAGLAAPGAIGLLEGVGVRVAEFVVLVDGPAVPVLVLGGVAVLDAVGRPLALAAGVAPVDQVHRRVPVAQIVLHDRLQGFQKLTRPVVVRLVEERHAARVDVESAVGEFQVQLRGVDRARPPAADRPVEVVPELGVVELRRPGGGDVHDGSRLNRAVRRERRVPHRHERRVTGVGRPS
mmetsp:Transcript_2290/g.7736  ORF Transcript_2290/g.7736 Transcript_2290/m.7736 type:complete len:225 (-) Transcript_2290:1845-2519(-)